MTDTALPPIRLDDVEGLLVECMRLEAELADRQEAGRRTEWLETQMVARAVLLEWAINNGGSDGL